MCRSIKIRFDIHYVIAVHVAFTTTTTTSSSSSFLLVYFLCLSCTYADPTSDYEAFWLGVTVCRRTAIGRGGAKVWLSRRQCRARMHYTRTHARTPGNAIARMRLRSPGLDRRCRNLYKVWTSLFLVSFASFPLSPTFPVSIVRAVQFVSSTLGPTGFSHSSRTIYFYLLTPVLLS
jgi:hypothetical protein